MLVSKKHSALKNAKSLQLASWISVKYIVYTQFMVASICLRSGWAQLLSWNKETLDSGKNCSLQLNTVNCKEKMFFRNNYFISESFFMSCPFTKIFVHLLIIAAASNFNVYCDPANIYRLKINSSNIVINTRKRCEHRSVVFCY